MRGYHAVSNDDAPFLKVVIRALHICACAFESKATDFPVVHLWISLLEFGHDQQDCPYNPSKISFALASFQVIQVSETDLMALLIGRK